MVLFNLISSSGPEKNKSLFSVMTHFKVKVRFHKKNICNFVLFMIFFIIRIERLTRAKRMYQSVFDLHGAERSIYQSTELCSK